MPIEIGNLRKQKSSLIFFYFLFLAREQNYDFKRKEHNFTPQGFKLAIVMKQTHYCTEYLCIYTILLHKHMNQNTQPMHTYKIEEIDFTCPNDETTSLFNPLTFIRSIRFVINRQRYSCKKQSNYNPTDEKLRYIVLKLSISHWKNT